MQTVLRERQAGPIVIIDEVEKSGNVQSTQGSRHTLTDALLPLLERMTAETWECPYYQIRVDMSWANWVMRANSRWGLHDQTRIEQLNNRMCQHLIHFNHRTDEVVKAAMLHRLGTTEAKDLQQSAHFIGEINCLVEQCFAGAEQGSHTVRFPTLHVDWAEPAGAQDMGNPTRVVLVGLVAHC